MFERAAGKRHLALVMLEGLGALGKHQVVIGGFFEQRQQYSGLPTGGIRREDRGGALRKNRPEALVRGSAGAHSRSSSASSSQSKSSSASESMRSSSSRASVYSPRAMAAAMPSSSMAS